MKRLFILSFAVLVSAFSAQAQSAPQIILFNGKIFTADTAKRNAQAIAIRGESIAAVGSDEEIKKLAGAKTRLVDLKGQTVIPGVNDAHTHFMPHPNGVNLEFKSMEPSWTEVEASIADAVKTSLKGQWIFATVGGDAIASQAANRTSLDAVAPDNPVVIDTYYGHGQIINSRTMSVLKITDSETDPMGGYFERDPSNKKLNGRVWEYAQWRLDRKLSELVSDQEAIEGLKKMAGEAAFFGVTSLQIMSTLPIDRFVRLLEKADLPVRVRAMPFSLTDGKGRDLSEVRTLSKTRISGNRVSASGNKWILDGTPFEHGSALRRPYNDRPNSSGKLHFPESEVQKMLNESLSFGQQLLVHCAGDRPIDVLFQVMEKTKQANWPAKRWRIEHGDGLTADLIPEAKKLGIVVVQNPTHLSLVELVYARYSPQTGFFNLRSLIEAGIPVALGSDGPMNPYLNIMLASMNPARPAEAITREQAVRAYTFGSAFAEFTETRKGTLSKGKFADLTVLSQDIFSVPVPELPKTQSTMTIVGGKVVLDGSVPR